MPSMIIPTPPGAGQPITVRVGKYSRTFDNAASAAAWAADFFDSDDFKRDFMMSWAILLAARRPGTRGKTLTVDMAAPTNLVTVT